MLRNPIIGQYVEALTDPFRIFRTLGEVVPERDAYGEPLFWSGNYSAIFKVRCADGKYYALKCYTRLPRHAAAVYASLGGGTVPYLVPARFLPDEIYLCEHSGGGAYYPVTLMEWVEGESLGGRLARLCRNGDRTGLKELARAFDRMALWLLESDFAHGDLKQDNLMVDRQGRLRLIDYDGAYIGELAGRKAEVIGSPAYQHPSRDADFFGKAIDDYPIALISLSLHALALDPSLFGRYHDGENIIFDAAEVNRGKSALFDRLMREWARCGASALVVLGGWMQHPTPEVNGLPGLLRDLSGNVPDGLSDGIEIVDDENPRCAVFRCDGRFGYADLQDRRILLQNIYLDAKPFREGLAVVRLEEGFWMIDPRGHCRIDCRDYRSVEPLSEGLALVSDGSLYGFIDREGRRAIPLRYVFATSFREGLAAVRIGDKFGYIDVSGELAGPPVFDYAGCFRNGRARVEKNGESFFIGRFDRKWQIRV